MLEGCSTGDAASRDPVTMSDVGGRRQDHSKGPRQQIDFNIANASRERDMTATTVAATDFISPLHSSGLQEASGSR